MMIGVTGGAGFMGSNFIRFMLSRHPEVSIVNVDKLTYAGNLANTKDFSSDKRYKFFRKDICNLGDMKKIFQKCEVIVHYAAETHVDRSIDNAESFIKSNVMGTMNVLEVARKYGSKLVHISTDEVYGSIRKGRFSEESILNPSNPYSASKASSDLLVLSYVNTYDMDALVTRSCNFYGPYQYPEKLIPLSITNILRKKKVPIYGTGQNSREWIFTEDHCTAIEMLMNAGKKGEIYNISSMEEKTNIEVVDEICSIMDAGNMIEHVDDRKGHDFRYSLDAGKIRKLGWKPSVKFNDGIRKTVEWYSSNANWWQSLI